MNKGLEALNKIYNDTYEFSLDLAEGNKAEYELIKEELKAFEIIKPYLKKIVGMNVYDKDFYECFLQIGNERVSITKEKYDLLMEMLRYE